APESRQRRLIHHPDADRSWCNAVGLATSARRMDGRELVLAELCCVGWRAALDACLSNICSRPRLPGARIRSDAACNLELEPEPAERTAPRGRFHSRAGGASGM